jgi:hypothetical protein
VLDLKLPSIGRWRRKGNARAVKGSPRREIGRFRDAIREAPSAARPPPQGAPSAGLDRRERGNDAALDEIGGPQGGPQGVSSILYIMIGRDPALRSRSLPG